MFRPLGRLQDGQQATNGAPTTSDITSRSTKYHYSISVVTVSDAGQYECAMSSVSRGTTVRSSIIPVYVRGRLYINTKYFRVFFQVTLCSE